MGEGHCQSDEHWNRFKGNVGGTCERRGGAHIGFSERIDTILNWTELNSVTVCYKKWKVEWEAFNHYGFIRTMESRVVSNTHTHTHTHTRARAHAHARTHARMHTHTCARARAHTHTHTHARTRTRTPTHSHARTQRPLRLSLVHLSTRKTNKQTNKKPPQFAFPLDFERSQSARPPWKEVNELSGRFWSWLAKLCVCFLTPHLSSSISAHSVPLRLRSSHNGRSSAQSLALLSGWRRLRIAFNTPLRSLNELTKLVFVAVFCLPEQRLRPSIKQSC